MSAEALWAVYDRLLETFGPQHWWPGDDPFEIMVGAVLTQNTAWTNVERAIQRLRRCSLLDPNAMLAAPEEELADAIRPSGYFNVKARRLRALCRSFLAHEGVAGMDALETGVLRERLLAVHGIGRETADDILLYAFQRPVFVIDAYTRRIFSRLGVVAGDEGYEMLRGLFEGALGENAPVFNEYHALIVRLGKDICRPRPLCPQCPLQAGCPAATRP
ncbi:MAG: endonuclease III domain-containing protein [Ectothiorhodospiraceae bacterium]